MRSDKEGVAMANYGRLMVVAGATVYTCIKLRPYSSIHVWCTAYIRSEELPLSRIVNLALNSSMRTRQIYHDYVSVETTIVSCTAVVRKIKRSQVIFDYILV